MSDTVVHNIKLSYDESDDRVRAYVSYLRGASAAENLKKYHDEALKSTEHKIYLSDENGNEFTFTCDQVHICHLRTRGM